MLAYSCMISRWDKIYVIVVSILANVDVAPGWITGNVHCIHLRQKANKTEPTLTLKPRGDVNRNPKQGYQWSQKEDM